MHSFGKFTDKLNAKFSVFAKRTGLAKFGQQLGNVGGKLKGVGEGFGSMFRRAGALGAVLVGGGGIFGKLVHDAAESADQLKKLSERSGVGIERLQTLGFAANQTGISTDEFQQSIDGLNGRLGLLKRGGGPLMKSLGKLSPALVSALKGAKNSEEAFGVLQKAMSMTDDATVKAQIAQAAFGKSGTKFVNFLSLESKELAELEAQGRRNGIVTADQAAQAEKMQDAFSALMASLKGLRNGALAPLFEPLTELALALREIAIEVGPQLTLWVKDLVKGFLNGRTATEAAKDAFKSLKESLSTVISVVSWFVDTFGAANLAIAAIVGWIFGPLLAAIAALIPSLISLAGAFLALTWPVQAVILAVVALIAIGVLLWKKWDAIKQFFINLWNNPIAKFLLFLTPIGHLIFLAGLIVDKWSAIKDFFINLWASITAAWDLGISVLKDHIRSLLNLLPDVIKTKLGIDTTAIDKLQSEKQVAGGTFGGLHARSTTQNASVQIDFNNAPKGTKMRSDKTDANLTLNMGFAGGVM